MTMANAKQTALELIERMPDDVTIEDIMYELYFRQRVDSGLKQIAEGKTVSHDEVVESMAKWLRSAGP